MSRMRPSDETLQRASDLVFYEIAVLFALARLLIERRCRNEVLRNAVIEAFGIHLRVCYDFLFVEPKREGIWLPGCGLLRSSS